MRASPRQIWLCADDYGISPAVNRAIRELIARLSERWDDPPFIVITGGGAALAAPHLPEARWEPHLALEGLVLVARS